MISSRIQYELNKNPELKPTEIILGSWIFEEFLKERETEELRTFNENDELEYLGIKVTVNKFLDPLSINIFRSDKLGINNLVRAGFEFGIRLQGFTESLSKFTPIALVTQRYAKEKDFEKNFARLSNIPKNLYKPFIKMLKAGFTIDSAIQTLKETYNK